MSTTQFSADQVRGYKELQDKVKELEQRIKKLEEQIAKPNKK